MKQINKFLMVFVIGLFVMGPAMALAYNNLGSINETIGVGRVFSMGLNEVPGSTWAVTKNTNPSVAATAVTKNNLEIKSLAAGSAIINVCAYASDNCLEVNLTVAPDTNVLGASTGLAYAPQVITAGDINQFGHKAGTWIISGKTVYYVTADGLVPVPSWQIFVGNGGQAKKLVKANQYDLARNLLDLMSASDSRVK